MIIVGEKINSTRKSIAQALEKRDAEFIATVAREQAQAGAHYIDVNAGTYMDKEEVEYLCWLVEVVQEAVDLPLCLDSPNPKALSEAIKRHKGEPMINSISLEKDRFLSLFPVVTSQPCKVVALCMAQTSMPRTVDERVSVGSELIRKLTDEGIPIGDIYVDPLVQPVAVDIGMGLAALGAVQKIMNEFPGVNTICGLSNISFGLPNRHLVNRNFLALAMGYGLSAAILDPTDTKIMATLLSVEMLLGRDQYCQKFVKAYQQGRIAGN
jgi:5-methyltetrahydrofolate corrinoid/iron sulfur protein methyltransferase